MDQPQSSSQAVDYLIIGSGFGGSVSAMRLVEKGYSVLVLEKGKRFRDADFPKSNWNIFKFLWMPALRCFGFQQLTLLNGVMVLHGSGVGGGSLVYANVLMKPERVMFEAPAWSHLADWQAVLRPHYDTARRMLGVVTNPRLWPADHALRAVAEEMGVAGSFQPTEVGVFYGDPDRQGEEVPDPYFGGEGPSRHGCIHCGGCMVGCWHNAKNTLLKNYLYLAEKWGARVIPETTVTAIRPLTPGEPDGARYEVDTQRTTGWLVKRRRVYRAKNVIVAASVLGTLKLLFHCRDVVRTLPDISKRLGDTVRTNSEALVGVTARKRDVNYSEGIAITSIFKADDVTAIEPVRYPDKSSFMRTIAAPMIEAGDRGFLSRVFLTLWEAIRRPYDFLYARFFSRWALYSTILLVMQTTDNLMSIRPGRNLFTLFRRGLACFRDTDRPIKAEIPIGHHVTRQFAQRINAVPQSAINESLFNIPTTAHILGGVPFGLDAEEGVIGLNCEVHNYPGLYVVDGSIMPANPGVNPSLTITALAEYAMAQVPPKAGGNTRPPMLVNP